MVKKTSRKEHVLNQYINIFPKLEIVCYDGQTEYDCSRHKENSGTYANTVIWYKDKSCSSILGTNSQSTETASSDTTSGGSITDGSGHVLMEQLLLLHKF